MAALHDFHSIGCHMYVHCTVCTLYVLFVSIKFKPLGLQPSDFLGIRTLLCAYDKVDYSFESTTYYTGTEILKKHYNNLWVSLPEDHMITLGRFYEINICKLSDEAVNQIVSSTNSQWSNCIILNGLILVTKNDNQLLGLSYLIERLATGGVLVSDCPNIESFRNG